jgi:hypothetical protein
MSNKPLTKPVKQQVAISLVAINEIRAKLAKGLPI